MKRTLAIFICLAIAAVALGACGWKPNVSAVPITAPWNKMKLPVTDNAVVWASTESQFKAAHKDDKKTVLAKYTDALKADGWTLGNFDNKSDSNWYLTMTKGSDKLEVEIYDFENTGVIITKK